MNFLGRRVGAVTAQPRSAYRLPSFPWGRVGVGAAVTLGIALLAATVGSVYIPPADVARIIAYHLHVGSASAAWPVSWDAIVWDVRLPRVMLAGLVGASLSMSGTTYQGLFRNPLADPYLVGVAAGAGLGATAVMVSPLPAYVGGFSLVPPVAFLSALMVVALAYSVARLGGGTPTTTLILAGVAVASLAGAATTFLMMTRSSDVRPVLSWLLGSLASSGWNAVAIVLPYLLLSSVVVLLHGRILNVMQLDEEQARQLGVNVERTKLLLVAAASLATAAAVSVSGLIGFVGLIAPHAARLVWGHDHRSLLPMAMVLGAAFLIVADLIARTALSPREAPIGVVTAFFGAPFFLYLLRRRRPGP